MNFTKALAGNFSSAIVDCQVMGSNVYTYGETKFKSFNNDIGYFILSFLFNLMGNSLTFKSILDEINKDIKNYYYADIFTQYGRLIRTVFDFEPMETASLQANGIDWSLISKSLHLDPEEFKKTMSKAFAQGKN